MKYDIFISYKRKGTSSATAAYLYELLQQKGYNVFFDRKEMRSGKFNEQILEHISNATDILILLEEESLGSWFDYRGTKQRSRAIDGQDPSGRMAMDADFQEEPYKTDWFCREIMHALSQEGKNIVPILLNGYLMPEGKDLPPEMAELSLHNALSLEISEIEEFYEKHLVEQGYLKSKPVNLSLTKRFQSKGGVVGCFLLYTDVDSCDLYECGEKIVTLTDSDDEWHPFRYPVNFAGEHRFRAINNDSCEVVTIRCSVETNCQQYVQIKFTDTRDLWQLTKEEIAAQDDVERLYYWGRGLFDGTTKHEPDITLSFECLKRAIDLGSEEALSFVSSYGTGLVDQKHAPIETVLKWYIIAAEQGNKDAQRNLGLAYANGQGVEKDFEKAFEWFSCSAGQGDSYSQYRLGRMYLSGQGIAKDNRKAFEWYQKAAEQGDAMGQVSLGNMYADGKGVNQDYAKALELYERAAEQGNARGPVQLGYMYYEGIGVQQNYEKAFEWNKKAAELGNASGAFNLGNMYYEGSGVQQDYDKAYEWYKKAAEQGDASGAFNLGNMYYEGIGVQQNYEKAFEWYMKAAMGGDADGQCAVGNMFEEGLGVDQDYGKAFEWYQKAAEQGDAMGQISLGHIFEDGMGVDQDYRKAVEWYQKAAEQGDAKGQVYLGDMYIDGKGIEQDYRKAVEWYKKSAEQGEEALNDVAWAYHLMGEYENALPWALKAVDAMPDNPDVVDTLATVYENLGRYDEAMAQFKKCLQMYKESGEDKGIQRTSESIKSLKKKMAAGKK